MLTPDLFICVLSLISHSICIYTIATSCDFDSDANTPLYHAFVWLVVPSLYIYIYFMDQFWLRSKIIHMNTHTPTSLDYSSLIYICSFSFDQCSICFYAHIQIDSCDLKLFGLIYIYWLACILIPVLFWYMTFKCSLFHEYVISCSHLLIYNV